MDRPWIILDRDGVINYDSDDYIKSVAEWRPIPGSIDAIARLKNAGYSIAVATNQSGLARGLLSLDELEAIHEKLRGLVARHDTFIDWICYCPHRPEDHCDCRKPNTAMLDALEREYNINLRGSWLVGDQLKDLQLAKRKECRPVLVLSGKGATTAAQLNDDDRQQIPIFSTLETFADALLTGTLS